MSASNGYNPMQWDCVRQGCFNLKKRPKIETFADSLPGKIAFSDVDGVVEINGNLLFMEWKSHGDIPRGQRILFERLTRFASATVLIVEGDAETMQVETICHVHEGRFGEPSPANLASLKKLIADWSRWAARHPVMHQGRARYHLTQAAPETNQEISLYT